ncbi:MAG: arginase family protein, partial [Dongiaceae bacterium]
GRPGGTERAPWILRQLGLRAAVQPRQDLNDLAVRIDGEERDPESGVKGAPSVAAMTREVRRVIEHIVRAGDRPLIVGGCCSCVMGAVAGVRDAMGRSGLVYVDGHLDLYDGNTSPTGECADMPLAFMLGRGPALLDEPMGARQPIEVGDVSLLGYRDRHLAEPAGSLLPEDLGPDFHHRDVDAIRAIGMEAAAEEAVARQGDRAGRFWLHLDWDVLDRATLPSADYLMPNGLSWDELISLVRPLVRSPRMIGMSLACYNPDNDPDLTDGRRVVDAMAQFFAR